MADSISDADKIRNKRLAKLGGNQSEPDSSSDSAQQPVNVDSVDSKSEDKTSAASSPFSQLGLKPRAASATQTINITAADSGSSTPTKRDRHGASRLQGRSSQETLEAWEDRILGSIFRVTLNSQATKDAHGHALIFLKEVKSELEEQGSPNRLSTDLLDQVIIEAANSSGMKPLEYTLSCWKRVSRQFRSMRSSSVDDPKYAVIREARKLCMSWCILAITTPDVFDAEIPADNQLAEKLLVDPDNEYGICSDFLTEAVARFPDDDSIRDALVAAMEDLSQSLARIDMNQNYKPYVLALRNFVRYQPLVEALAKSPRFLHLQSSSDLQAVETEMSTLLGPFFRLSPMLPDVATNYFSSPKTRDRAYIANSQNALRLTLQTHQRDLLDIANGFIKSSKESRERILDWFAQAINTNHKRRAIQVDERYVSSDGFMVNITTCLDQLCEPFMDSTFTKIHRIEVDYLRRSPRVNIQDETKMNADEATSDEFYKAQAEGQNNFISEIFFLTVAAHHYGTEAANTKLATIRRQLKHMEKQIEKFEEGRSKFLNQPDQLRRFDEAIKKHKDLVEKGHCVYFAIEGVLLDELSQARSMQFMRYVIVWLMRLASGGEIDFPRKPLELPLPSIQPENFKNLPEYFIEDVVDSFKFITGHMPQVITSTQCDEIVMICITFLNSSEYIKNPYLKSGLITILYHGVLPFHHRSRGILGDVLNSLPFANKYLLHALMKFYIECEATGAHNQFYDKFRIRYEIFQVIRCIWANPAYREKLAIEATQNLDFFVRFTNLLLNDVTFVLDESFTAFHKIHDLQKELRDNSTLDEAARTEKEEALDDAQNKAKSYMSLTTETLGMLKLFTESLADAFTTPEVVQRLADMLDYNLDALVGPKQSNLKVENPAQYSFDPKSLLSDILDVYLNLSSKKSFQLAVARDGRSYKPNNFVQASSIMTRWSLKSPEQLSRWRQLTASIQKAKEEDAAEEQELGEVPDEFLDPLVCTLMDDPVILPVSKVIINRSTIRSHLLSDPTDPFNRHPLKIEDVIPATEMLERINAFRAAHRGQRMVGAVDGVQGEGDTDENMDTT